MAVASNPRVRVVLDADVMVSAGRVASARRNS
jgi:hypothetical protein